MPVGSAALRAMAQQVIGQHHGHHRLGDGRGADADAGIVTALGAQLDLVAEAVDAAHVVQDRTGRLHDQAADDVLPGRNPAQNAAGVVAEEGRRAVLHAHLVGIVLAAHRRRGEAVGDAGGHDLDDRADRAATLADVVEIAFPALCRLAVGAPEGIVRRGVPVPLGAVDLLGAELDHGAAELDAVTQDLAGDGAGGDAHRRLARRLPAAAAIVAHAVFLEIGVVGVGGAETVLDLPIVARALVDIVDVQRDRRAGGDALEHAGQDLHRVRLLALGDEARLAGPALLHPHLDVGFAQRDARRRAVDDATDRRPVAFAPAGEPEEGAETAAGHGCRPPSYSPSKLPSSSAICLADEVLIMPTTW